MGPTHVSAHNIEVFISDTDINLSDEKEEIRPGS